MYRQQTCKTHTTYVSIAQDKKDLGHKCCEETILLLVWSCPIQVRVKRIQNSQCPWNRPNQSFSTLMTLVGFIKLDWLQSYVTLRRRSEKGSTEMIKKRLYSKAHSLLSLKHYSSTRTFSGREEGIVCVGVRRGCSLNSQTDLGWGCQKHITDS